MEGYFLYKREVNYYETDRMGIVHHSNYARYLEEARIRLLEGLGIPLTLIEGKGYMIPVLSLSSRFLESIKFGERINIYLKLSRVSSAKFFVEYKIYDETGTRLLHEAESSHCFIDSAFKPVAIKKLPEEIAGGLSEAAK